MKNILITGGAGFIGSHLVKRFVHNYPDYNIYNIDNLTYAGSLKNVKEIENKKNYFFLKLDINNHKEILKLFKDKKISDVIHLAAESHVDRSIESSFEFAKTNVLGTLSLLEACKKSWNLTSQNNFFYHISTDEVYGSLNKEDCPFTEASNFAPSSPYSASKASSDLLVEAWGKTYDLRYLITNCSNNFGPRQFCEKLVPKVILNCINKEKIPIYGSGLNIRDWLFVGDHIDAILSLYDKGLFINDRFNIGGGHEVTNIEMVKAILQILDKKYGFKDSEQLIEYVKDRKGHDFRYSIDSAKLETATGWKPATSFNQQLEITVKWYVENSDWWSG